MANKEIDLQTNNRKLERRTDENRERKSVISLDNNYVLLDNDIWGENCKIERYAKNFNKYLV